MTHVDGYGLAFTTDSAAAAGLYVEALDLTLSDHIGVRERLHRALDRDPKFALARALLAFHLQFDADRAPAVAQILVAAQHVRHATRREQQAVDALRRAVLGDTVTARRLIGRHLREFPRDALMVRELVFLHGYGGASGRKASVLAALRRLDPQMGGDPWFLGQYSLALSEIGEIELASRLANAALAARPDHGVAAHAVAHIHFESGDNAGARDFLQDWLPTHAAAAVTGGHLTWHLALAQLGLANPDAALHAYRAQRSMPGAQAFRLEDSVSLLWRLHMRGVDVSREWTDIAQELPAPSPDRAFQLAHIAFAMAAVRDDDALRHVAELVTRTMRERPQEPLRFLPPLLDALRLVAVDRWSEAAPALAAAAAGARRLGGSNEQHVLYDEAVAFARATAA